MAGREPVRCGERWRFFESSVEGDVRTPTALIAYGFGLLALGSSAPPPAPPPGEPVELFLHNVAQTIAPAVTHAQAGGFLDPAPPEPPPPPTPQQALERGVLMVVSIPSQRI